MTDLEVKQALEKYSERTEAGQIMRRLAEHARKQKEYAEGQARINEMKSRELRDARASNGDLQQDMAHLKVDRDRWKNRHEAAAHDLAELRGLRR